MRRTLVALVCTALVAAAASGCKASPEQVVAAGLPQAVSAHGSVDPALPIAINDFGFDLVRVLRAQGQNTVVSPLSVHAALSMTAIGARGDTAEEMSAVLHLDEVDQADGGWSWQYLLSELQQESEATLDIANSLWAQEGAPLEDEFLNADRDFFGAEIRTLDLHTNDAIDEINGWVANNTGERITEIIDEPDPDSVLEIINAVYFLGDWQQPFEANATEEQLFIPADGNSFDVPMMHAVDLWDYGESDTAQVVRMPYSDWRYAAYVIVPGDGSTPDTVLDAMTADEWTAIRDSLAERNGAIALPRFEIEWGAGQDLAAPLATMGMSSAFDYTTADFSGISAELDADPGLEISHVSHKTYLRVDEAGTEAAAATDVGISLGSIEIAPEEPFELRADHPFIFAIGDETSGSLLFLGVIEDPRE